MQTHLSLFSCVHWLKHLHVVDELVQAGGNQSTESFQGEVDNPVCCWKKPCQIHPQILPLPDCGRFGNILIVDMLAISAKP